MKRVSEYERDNRPQRNMPPGGIIRGLSLTLVFLILSGLSTAAGATREFLASQGEARAVIVSGNGEFYHFAAQELQRYFEAFTGARIEIVTPAQARQTPKDLAWILLGGPQANELVQEAASRKLVNFEGLKVDGFILRTTKLGGHRVLVAGGNDEAATLYSVYDLLERYGAVFLLTGDILPEKKTNLELREFDVRSDPAFRRRGFVVSFIYPNRSIMSLDDERKFIDQMAKMKMNYLQIFWFPYEPWLKYDYRGETKWMGDVAKKETGYVLWARDFGSFKTDEMKVGEEHFKKAGVYPRLAPPEFQHIENNEQAFEAAQKYLHETIAYAAKRKIKVWLSIDATSVVPNLARYTTRTLSLPFHPIFGTFTCPDNPVSLELNENRLKSLIETYPEAEGYFLFLPEAYPVCNQTAEDRQFYINLRSKYPGEAQARAAFTGDIAQDDDTVIDSNAGSVYLIQKLMEARDRIAPNVKLGIGGLGRLYLWPSLNRMFPASVPLTDMESSAIWTPAGVPMQMFGGMGERESTLLNRIDDDSDMLGMQFNVNLYYKDRVLEDGLKYGLAGFASQMNRARGTETNTKFMAEGEWNPHLTPEEFYRDYANRIFGDRASPLVLKAFHTLEKNEEYLGWTGRGNFPCCGPLEELSVAYTYSKQENLFDGPRFRGWRSFVSRSHDQIAAYTESTRMLQEAVDNLKGARGDAEPRSQAYLTYLINRTEAYILHLQTLATWEQAYIDLDNAFLAYKPGGDRKEFLSRLDGSLTEFQDARSKARTMAEKWSEFMDHPSDLGALYRINVFMVEGTDLVAQLIQNVDNFHHGRDYVQPVDFGKIFTSWPALASGPWQASQYANSQ